MATLQTLAATIADKAAEITRILDSKGLAQPQLGETGIDDFADIDYELRDARNALIRAGLDAVRLAQGPEDQVLALAWSAADAANLSTIVRFNIAGQVPRSGQISAVDLAAATGLDADVLARVVRYAIGNGIFYEPEPAVFAHTAPSALLGRNEHLRDIVSLSSDDMVRVISRQGETLQRQQEDPANAPATAFNVAFPDYAHVFEYFSKNPEVGRRYHNYLLGRVHTSRWSVDHLTSCWDWPAIGGGTVVDVGGSSGHTCAALARVCPNAKFVIEDVNPDALVKGRELLSADADVFRRTTFVIHDFFTPQSVEGDVYIFRHIFHDWSDEDTMKILNNLLPALKPGARVLVSEGLVPDPPARRTGCLDERLILLEDMFMLGVHAGRERSAADFARLFTQVSPKFALKGVTGGRQGEFQSLMEFVYQP